jgi:hypothetical protein
VPLGILILASAGSTAVFGWQALRPVLTSPRIVLDPPVRDFGTCTPNEDVEAKFRIKNTGWVPLKISAVHSSCTCTTSTLANPDIAPGQSSELTVKLRVQPHNGEFTQRVQVQSNDPRSPTAVFVLKGTAKPVQDSRVSAISNIAR